MDTKGGGGVQISRAHLPLCTVPPRIHIVDALAIVGFVGEDVPTPARDLGDTMINKGVHRQRG